MFGWHHQLKGHEFEQTPGDSEGQGSLVCCSPWGHQESDMNLRLNNNNVYFKIIGYFLPCTALTVRDTVFTKESR